MRTDVDDLVRGAGRAVQAAAAAGDGLAPFSEAVTLRWAPGAPPAAERHLVLRTTGAGFTGYAYLDDTGTAELAVLPAARRRGSGTALLEELRRDGARRIWAHGGLPPARAFAAHHGYRAVRELLQLRLAMTADPAPDGVTWPRDVLQRAFRPGADDAAWVALNARAFASHPEQGRMTEADLRARMAEPWFSADGFIVAEKDGAMAGYHWTKLHPDESPTLGEVYVLGVDPALHGGGLGRALTRAGLHHLYGQGIRTVLLYVEADNASALAVYRRLGFADFSADVMYERE
jgi:mycothiol synthase